jgi:prepilin-type N-terminal cleavage/methylation domain-containing protein/prepilin-type processing-associated H-X9-DG protein
MNQNAQERPRSGFSLIELVVVIGIVAMLAAILLPVVTQMRIAEQKRTGDKNIRKVGLAILSYMRDNDGKFPRSGYDCRNHDDSFPGDFTVFAEGEGNQCGGDGWQDVVGPYVGDPAAFVSTRDKSAVGEGPWGGGTGTSFNTTDGNLSFAINDLLAHRMPTNSGGYADPSQQDPVADGLRLSDVRTPSECVLLAEGHSGWDKAGATDGNPNVVVTDWTGSTDIQNKWHHQYTIDGNCTFQLTSSAYDGSQFIRLGLPFNNNGGNVLFTDGHVRFVPYQNSAGFPVLCSTLPWTTSMDPQQRNADRDSCNDPNNPLPASWTNPNWF